MGQETVINFDVQGYKEISFNMRVKGKKDKDGNDLVLPIKVSYSDKTLTKILQTLNGVKQAQAKFRELEPKFDVTNPDEFSNEDFDRARDPYKKAVIKFLKLPEVLGEEQYKTVYDALDGDFSGRIEGVFEYISSALMQASRGASPEEIQGDFDRAKDRAAKANSNFKNRSQRRSEKRNQRNFKTVK